jgi:hypothetical protein
MSSETPTAAPLPPAPPDPAARASASWEEIQAATAGAEARGRETYAAIEAAHHEAAARADASARDLDAAAQKHG